MLKIEIKKCVVRIFKHKIKITSSLLLCAVCKCIDFLSYKTLTFLVILPDIECIN